MGRSICAVFDIDDTLYLERDYVRSGFEAAGRWAAESIHVEDFAKLCWSSFLAGRRGSNFEEALRVSGKEAYPELVSALVDVYRNHIPGLKLAADAAEALSALSHAASIAIVSDGPAISQQRKVEALGLDCLASRIVLTERLGVEYRKPHPKAFEMITQWLPANVYLYVADNPRKDFAAPKQLGWITVRVRRPLGLHYAVENREITPDYEMVDCSTLPEVLRGL